MMPFRVPIEISQKFIKIFEAGIDEAFEVFKKNGPKALGDWAEKIICESED
jgi:hypothetical protein